MSTGTGWRDRLKKAWPFEILPRAEWAAQTPTWQDANPAVIRAALSREPKKNHPLEWAPKSYCSGLQRAIGVGSKELNGTLFADKKLHGGVTSFRTQPMYNYGKIIS